MVCLHADSPPSSRDACPNGSRDNGGNEKNDAAACHNSEYRDFATLPPEEAAAITRRLRHRNSSGVSLNLKGSASLRPRAADFSTTTLNRRLDLAERERLAVGSPAAAALQVILPTSESNFGPCLVVVETERRVATVAGPSTYQPSQNYTFNVFYVKEISKVGNN